VRAAHAGTAANGLSSEQNLHWGGSGSMSGLLHSFGRLPDGRLGIIHIGRENRMTLKHVRGIGLAGAFAAATDSTMRRPL